MQRALRPALPALLIIAALTAACNEEGCDQRNTLAASQRTTPSAGTRILGVTVTPPNASLNAGDSVSFVATVNAEAGAIDRTVTWTSSNTNVATVDGAGAVTARVAGTATIIATSNGDTTVSGAAAVTVGGSSGTAPTAPTQ